MLQTGARTPEAQLAEAFAAMMAQQAQKGVGFKHNATGTPTTDYAHGPGGIFTYPGLEPGVFSTIVGIEKGIIGAIPKFPSVITNPVYETITGVRADVGTEPDEVCDPAVVGGLLKEGKLTSVFGRYRRQTRELYLDRLGQRTDRSDMNLTLMNGPFGSPDTILHPSIVPGAGSNVLNNEVMKVLFELGVSVNRLLAQQIYTGNPANNPAGEGHKELTGLNLLVNTGKVDAETGVLLPSLDSDVKDFNFGLVDEADPDIVNVLTYLYRFVRTTARKTGMDPVQWVFTMREELFYELTAVWPCAYLTQRCTFIDGAGGSRLNVDARDAVDFRDAMRAGQYLLIDGIRVPVIMDDGITELTDADSVNIPAGEFASDIFLLPLTVLGGTPVLFLDYFEHQNTDIMTALSLGGASNQVWITNAGAWIWTSERTRLCVLWEGKVEPRLVLRTPQLAGRLQNVRYAPLQHTREPFPDAPYFVDGGNTSRTGPSLFSEWNLPA